LLPDGKIEIINDIDTASVVAWKNGLFSFNDADIPAVMRQVNRWYDAEIVYQSDVSQHFMGSIPRTVPISKLLTMLELTGRLHFRIDGRKIIVTQ
jgi:ferric-dicitrate binding protein FerR (iron transport regulator)